MMGDGDTSIRSSCAHGWGARKLIKPPSKSLCVQYPLQLEAPWQPIARSLLSVLIVIVKGGLPTVHLWATDGFWLYTGPFVA